MKFYRVFFLIILAFCIAFTIFIGVDKISQKKDLSTNEGYKGIITLWHVDTFEGGSGSRKNFLLKIARDFEKENKGVLVFVVSHTVESVMKNFSNNIYPNVISYGAGVEVENVVSFPLEYAFKGGVIEKNNIAIPWCRGGYSLIKNNEFSKKNINKNFCAISNAEYNVPIISLMESNFKFNLKIKNQFNAYCEFVNGQVEYLLGTQRDVVRLNNRGFNYSMQVIDGYNDLYQYVSVFAGEQDKVDKSIDFVDFLLSEKSQLKLNEIDMFSCFYSVEYANENMRLIQNVANSKTISILNKRESLLNLKEQSLLAYEGEENAYNKIKNFMI